jgi:C1A family cysteine protease
MNEHRTYDECINQFTAMTQEEFAQSYLGTVVVPDNIVVDSSDDISVGDVNWVEQGAVTGVKDQKTCGSCWAFSTTGSLEGLSKIRYGTLESFSEQQLVDCSGKYGNMGCNGGFVVNAFNYVQDNGIVFESDYPDKAVKQTCHTNSGSFKISGFVDASSCYDLANAVTGRPVSVAVDANNWSRYSKGIFSNCKTSLDHSVLLVGITDEYWLVKNSWGTTWGESGYIRLARGNTCGICTALYPNK